MELIDSNTVIVGDFDIPLTLMDRSTKQKIKKETAALNNILDQVDLADIFGTLPPKTAEHTFFSIVHGMFSRIDHILGHKTCLNKLKKTEVSCTPETSNTLYNILKILFI